MSLIFWEHHLFASWKKNRLKKTYQRKAILFLESEIDLLKFTFRQTNQLINKNVIPYNSKVYFVPKSQGLGIDSVGEFAVSFELSGQFFNEEGILLHIFISPMLWSRHSISRSGMPTSQKNEYSNASPTT